MTGSRLLIIYHGLMLIWMIIMIPFGKAKNEVFTIVVVIIMVVFVLAAVVFAGDDAIIIIFIHRLWLG